jgi:NAD+ diphosphatase
MMIGFVATYAGGDVVVDREELDDACWFACDALPSLPSRHSISRYIIDQYGQP